MMRDQKTRSKITGLVHVLSILLLLCSPHSVLAQDDIELILHNVNITPLESGDGFRVEVNFSVLDINDRPISGLGIENFQLLENGEPVDIDTLATKDVPLNIILVIDTSGSMIGGGIAAVKTAASRFVNLMGEDDRIAVLSFNDTIQTELDYSSDKDQILAAIQNLTAVRLAGTCLYDAIHYAVEQSLSQPMGTRTVVALTDGVDETLNRAVCSQFTVPEVIEFATQEDVRVPIYTIGLGSQVNQQILTEIADQTFGNALFSADAARLEAMFELLSTQLKSEYILTYTSRSAVEESVLNLVVNHDGRQTQVERELQFPIIPPTIVEIVEPQNGAQVEDRVMISAVIRSLGKPISRVIFTANEEYIGEAIHEPYEISFDPYRILDEEIVIRAVALGVDNEELWVSEVTVFQPPVPMLATNTPRPLVETPVQEGEGSGEETTSAGAQVPTIALIIGLVLSAGLLIFGLLRVFGLQGKKKKAAKKVDLEGQSFYEDVQLIKGAETSRDEVTTPLARLEVVKSADKIYKGLVFPVQKATITVGAAYKNDIVLAEEPFIADHHMRLEYGEERFYVSEILARTKESGLSYPKTGTFINDYKLREAEKLEVKHGDEIRLGRNFKFRFVIPGQETLVEGAAEGELPDEEASG